MVLDGHIHMEGRGESSGTFWERAAAAGVGGGLVISPAPRCFGPDDAPRSVGGARPRLDALFSRTRGHPDLFAFFWIDPMENGAEEQVDIACEYGVHGFKVICDHYFASEERPMAVFRRIAAKGKPILFHSGILWDGKVSSQFNRPVAFEALLEIEGLRFSLAHASWPWTDECIALYGKLLHAASVRKNAAEMFIDITPGTPEIYRRDLLTKLFKVGYDLENNIVFGADCSFDDYASAWARKWIDIDKRIYEELEVGKDAVEKAFSRNLRRFVGASKEIVTRRSPTYNG